MLVPIITTIIVAGTIIAIFLRNRENKHEEAVQKQERIEKPDTLGLMMSTLNSIGCQPGKADDDVVFVSYQGEDFSMMFSGMYARIWDPAWAHVKVDDPALPRIREAVNEVNFDFGPTVVMTSPGEDGLIAIHTRMDIMLHPACPDNHLFVKAILNSFFDTKSAMGDKFQEIAKGQIANGQIADGQTVKRENRRPVGFNTDVAAA